MSNNNNDLKKILSNNFEKIKEFVEENTIAVAAVGAFAVLGGIYLLKSSKVNDDAEEEDGEDILDASGMKLSIRNSDSSSSSIEPLSAPPTPKTKSGKRQAEKVLIEEYVLICREYLLKDAKNLLNDSDKADFQQKRQLIVHTLHSIDGQNSLKRLNEALANSSGPPPPPPEPEELLNQRLVHRMMTDENYQVEKPQLSAIKQHVLAQAKRAFWDSKRQAILSGDYNALLSEIEAIILKIPDCCCLKPENANRLRAKLLDLIDLKFIQDQCKQNVFGIKEVRGLINQLYSVLIKRQSPQRDEASNEWHEKAMEMLMNNNNNNNVDEILANSVQFIIEGLHEIMDNIRLDLVNYMMAGLRAGLKQGRVGIEKQRELFQRRLDSGEVKLNSTKVWLAKAIEIELSRKAITISDLKQANPNAFEKLHRAAICDVCIVDNASSRKNNNNNNNNNSNEKGGMKRTPFSPIKTSISKQDGLPETLEVEMEDIEKIRNLLKAIVESATMMLKAKSFLGANQMKLKLEDFKKMHVFLHEMNEDNDVKEEVSAYGEDGRYSLLTISDPNSEKGRKKRLESAAALVASAYERKMIDGGTGKKLTDVQRKTLLNLFMQMVDGNDTTYKMMHKILRRTIREIVIDSGNMNIVELSAKIENVLRKKFIGETTGTVCKIAVQIRKLAAHNMAVHARTYNNLIKFVFNKMQVHMVKKK